MKIRFYNACIYTGSAAQTTPNRGEVWVEDDRITLVGNPAGYQVPSWDRQIDCRGNLIMPGFKNAHAHSGAVLIRSWCDDKPLQAWLDTIAPVEQKLTHDEFYWLTKLAIMEYLSSGITSAFDMYYDREAAAQAAVDTGFRFVLAGGLDNTDGDAQLIADQYTRYNNFHPRISYQLGFHAEYSNSYRLLQGVAEIAEHYKAPVYMHNSETRTEVDGCRSRYGVSPTRLFQDIGIFRYGGGGYHCVYFDAEDEEIFRCNGLYVITNSSSNLKLSSGIAPLERYRQKGIPIAIGTDGACSNNCLDFFREMFLMAGLQKLTEGAAAMPTLSVLHSACCVGAHAMQKPECDCLAPGKQADLVLIDLHRPNMQPQHHVLENIVFSGSKENVLLTMVSGNILYERGEFYIGDDAEYIYSKVSSIVKRVLGDTVS